MLQFNIGDFVWFLPKAVLPETFRIRSSFEFYPGTVAGSHDNGYYDIEIGGEVLTGFTNNGKEPEILTQQEFRKNIYRDISAQVYVAMRDASDMHYTQDADFLELKSRISEYLDI
jgi:hypothetical protein